MNKEVLIYGYIFARGGSKGVPGKNIKLLDGKPLIAYSIDALKDSSYVDRIIVSTDDRNIADVARKYGAATPFMRPRELASDNSPEILSWRHALEQASQEGRMPDIFVSAPATNPFRTTEDIDKAIKLFLSSDVDGVIAVTEASKNPYFHYVKLDSTSKVHRFMGADVVYTRRQDAPQAYEVAGSVYVMNPYYVMMCDNLLSGYILGCKVPREHVVDIDEPLDFEYAEFLIRRRQGRTS